MRDDGTGQNENNEARGDGETKKKKHRLFVASQFIWTFRFNVWVQPVGVPALLFSRTNWLLLRNVTCCVTQCCWCCSTVHVPGKVELLFLQLRGAEHDAFVPSESGVDAAAPRRPAARRRQ